MRLSQLAEEKRSWNPLTRSIAAKAEAELQGARHSRYAAALAETMRGFEGSEVPQIAKSAAAEEYRYRQYVSASLDLEEKMRDARTVLRDRISRVEYEVSVLERCGISRIVGCDANAGLGPLAAAVGRQCRALPEAMRRSAGRGMRREQRSRDQSRESMSIDV